jgi:hypothetical protein
VYVSVNSVSPQSRSRSRQSVVAIRHVFLEADEDGPRVLARIAARGDLPPPSYLLHSSRHRGAPEAACARAEDRHCGDVLFAAHPIAGAVQPQAPARGARHDGVWARGSCL